MYIHPHLKLFLKDLFFDALRSGFNLLFQKKKMPEADLSCKSRIARVYECAYDCVFRVITPCEYYSRLCGCVYTLTWKENGQLASELRYARTLLSMASCVSRGRRRMPAVACGKTKNKNKHESDNMDFFFSYRNFHYNL